MASSTPSAPTMQVPLLDLKQQYAALAHEILPAVEQVLASQLLINGPAVGDFEKAVAAYAHCAQAVGVSSGTDALLCALMALCIGPDDEVITSPFTFFATAGCIWRVGAKPVFADIDPQTFNINPAAIEAAVTPRTRAIMPVHLFGQMADMDAIMAIARRHNLAVIEDAAQSIGATYRGRQSGSIGTAGCFSFFPSKNLGGAGDGGMIVTQDNALAQRLRMFRNHGMEPKYYHACIGGNFRLDTIQAAYLHIKLKHLDAWSAKRRENAALYTALLADCPAVRTPIIAPENVSIFNQYVIRTAKRDELKNYLAARGIGTEIYYPLCLHQQECFKLLGHRTGDFPLSEQAAAEVLAIPIYPELTHQQIHYVAQAIKHFFSGR